MDPLDFREPEELLRIFRCKKTDLSRMENPHTFLRQLRDHDLIPEDRFQEVSRLKSKEDIKKGLYDILDQFEREQLEQPEQIYAFWRSVFQDIIMDKYPTLRLLHKNLTEGSPLPEEVVMKGTDQKKRKELSEDEDEDKEENSLKKKKKQRSRSLWDSDEEQPGPLSQLTLASPLKRGERNKLPVTCGDLKGTLYRDKLDKGQKCILFQQWFTPREFEKFSRKTSSKNWKKRIQCNGTPLGKLMEESGHIKYEGSYKKIKKFQYKGSTDEEETEDRSEFVRAASCQTDISFKKEIKPLSVLTDVAKIKEQTDEHERKESSGDEDEEKKTSQQTVFVRENSSDRDLSFKKQLEQEQTDEHKRKEFSADEDEEENPGKKQRSVEEQPGPLPQLSPASLLKNRDKGDVWASTMFKSQLPVTCGDLKSTLDKERLARGEKCILFENQWFTPGEFEKRAGKKSSKNWKWSIRCNDIPLGKLIQEGHLKSVKYKGGCRKAKKSLFPPNRTIPVEEETEEQIEQPQEDDHGRSKMVFKVTCGAVTGTLHKNRFASGTRGKSIRTETSWMSPVEFVKEASGQTDASWKRDIMCGGKPLSVLIEENILRIHSLLCYCELCKPDQEDLENQNNDDECCVCKSDRNLVVCDHCPRSFHQKCHLPHVEDNILGDHKPWMCTFCIFKITQMRRHSDDLEMEAAMSHQISRHMLECQYLLMYLYSADEEQTFASNPNLYLKNYSTVIQTPMWFDKVEDKLQKKEYHTVGEFVSDVQLIFSNCATYNRDVAEFFDSGRRLKELFDDEFKKVFNIRLSAD